MSRGRKFKQRVRAYAAEHGISYTAARRLLDTHKKPVEERPDGLVVERESESETSGQPR